MKKDSALYELTQSAQGMVWQAAFQHYSATMTDEERAAQTERPALFQIRGGRAESPGWMMVQTQEFDPEPLTVERFRKRAVYAAPNISLALLELLAGEKWLDRVGSEYYLTDEGRKINAGLLHRRIAPFAQFEPIPAEDITTLADLIGRVIDASMQATTPPGTWCLAHSRNRAPDRTASPLAHIIQYCSDFNAFRDDAHMAAYGAHDGVPGHIWEAFSFVASGEGTNANALYDQLAYRGYYTEDWQAALDDLSGRGWIQHTSNSRYEITPDGHAMRDEVERKTDSYFFAPWEVLTSAEYETLVTLLQTLHDTCAERII